MRRQPAEASAQAAGNEIQKLSQLPIATSDGRVIRLSMRESEEERVVAIEEFLEELLPGRFAALEDQRRAAVAADPSLDGSLPDVTWFAVVDDAPADVREQAFNLCMLREEARKAAALIGKYREVLATLQEPVAMPVGLQDVIGAPEPVTL